MWSGVLGRNLWSHSQLLSTPPLVNALEMVGVAAVGEDLKVGLHGAGVLVDHLPVTPPHYVFTVLNSRWDLHVLLMGFNARFYMLWPLGRSTGWRTYSPHIGVSTEIHGVLSISPTAAERQSYCFVSTAVCSFSDSSWVSEPFRAASVQDGTVPPQ